MSTQSISPQSIVRWSAAPVVTEVNGEVILMNLDRDRCYGLGTTGSEIWRRLREPILVADLAAQLLETYDAQPGQIESDLLRTLRQFADEGLIEIRSASR